VNSTVNEDPHHMIFCYLFHLLAHIALCTFLKHRHSMFLE